jgi:hypothetical protein
LRTAIDKQYQQCDNISNPDTDIKTLHTNLFPEIGGAEMLCLFFVQSFPHNQHNISTNTLEITLTKARQCGKIYM